MFKAIKLDIKKLFLHSKFRLLILCLTQVIAVLCILVAYGIISNLFAVKVEQTTLNTTYFINLRHLIDSSDPNGDTEGELNYTDFNNKINDVLENTNNWKSLSVYGRISFNGEELSFLGINPNLYYEYIMAENGFTVDDFEKGNKIVSIDSEALQKSEGEEIRLGEQEYTIRAAKSKTFAADILIPYNSLTDDFTITRFDLFLNDIPTKNEVDVVVGTINEKFGSQINVVPPEVPNLIENQFNNSSALITFLVSIIILINFSFLYNYVLITQTTVINTYKISGCEKRKTKSILLIEFEILSILMLPVSLILFFKLLCPYLAEYYNIFSTIYTMPSTTLIILGYFAIDAVVKLFEIIQCVNRIYSVGKGDVQL